MYYLTYKMQQLQSRYYKVHPLDAALSTVNLTTSNYKGRTVIIGCTLMYSAVYLVSSQ